MDFSVGISDRLSFLAVLQQVSFRVRGLSDRNIRLGFVFEVLDNSGWLLHTVLGLTEFPCVHLLSFVNPCSLPLQIPSEVDSIFFVFQVSPPPSFFFSLSLSLCSLPIFPSLSFRSLLVLAPWVQCVVSGRYPGEIHSLRVKLARSSRGTASAGASRNEVELFWWSFGSVIVRGGDSRQIISLDPV